MEMSTASTAADGGGTAGFECNICFGLAQDPVITRCGHLHCWPCLCEWLRFHSQSHECPVCKAVIQEEDLIPLYGRGDSTTFHQRLVVSHRREPTSGGLLRRRSRFVPAAMGQLRVPTVRSVRFSEIGGGGGGGGGGGYGSFGEGERNGEGGVVEEGNLDHNLKKILFLILAFVVFDFLII